MEMEEDCLLGVDFLKKTNSENVCREAFGFSELKKEQNLNCLRIQDYSEKVPSILMELYENDSVNLNKSQKDIFANLLNEYEDIFSEKIVAGNCDIVTHAINVRNSSPIKQIPRRIPIQMRSEVDKIIEELRNQGVIKEKDCE